MKVSIILLTPGPEKRPQVEEAIFSVIIQTHRDWELLVASEYPEMDKFLREKYGDPRIKHVPIPDGLGLRVLTRGRNLAIQQATGEAICFLDDDNLFMDERLELGVKQLEDNLSLDVSLCAVEFIGRDGKTFQVLDGRELTIEGIRKQGGLDIGAIMIRKEALGQIGWFDERLEGAEDLDLACRIWEHGLRRGYIDDTLYIYRQLGDELSKSFYGPGFKTQRERTYRWARAKRKPRIALWKPMRDNPKYAFTQGYIFDSTEDTLRQMGYDLLEGPDRENMTESDIVAVMAPFQFTRPGLKDLLVCHPSRRVAIMMEDPWVYEENLGVLDLFDYVFTNEEACAERYRMAGHRRTYCYPTSPASRADLTFLTFLHGTLSPEAMEPKFDLVSCGFPYRSRVKDIAVLADLLRGRAKIGVFGVNWPAIDGVYVNKDATPPKDLSRVYADAKMILVSCCTWQDRSVEKPPFALRTPTRGYIECAIPNVIPLIRRDREHTAQTFGPDALYYDSPEGAAEHILAWIQKPDGERIERLNRKAWAEFSYEARLQKLLNVVNNDIQDLKQA